MGIQPDGLSKSRSGGPPFLFGHEHEAQLKMRVSIVRLQFDGRATFLYGRIQIADTKKGFSQF
jgi:hypothetical protein